MVVLPVIDTLTIICAKKSKKYNTVLAEDPQHNIDIHAGRNLVNVDRSLWKSG